MVGVVSGSLYMRTHSLSRLAWSWVGGRLAPFYIHQMNRVNSHNGSAMMTATQTLFWNYYYYLAIQRSVWRDIKFAVFFCFFCLFVRLRISQRRMVRSA